MKTKRNILLKEYLKTQGFLKTRRFGKTKVLQKNIAMESSDLTTYMENQKLI